MQATKQLILTTLQTVRDHLEAQDESIKKRPNCFVVPVEEPSGDLIEQEDIKRVSLDLLDIGVFYAGGAIT